MIGSLLIVHHQHFRSNLSSVVKLDQVETRLRRVEQIKGWLPPKQIQGFTRVLNIYVPSYPQVRRLDPDKLDPIIPVPFPRQQAFEEIFYGFVERVGELFPGWTELGRVATPWQPAKDGGESLEFRWIYDHLLIATDDENWQEKLRTAESECEEAFLAVVTYYSDILPLPVAVES